MRIRRRRAPHRPTFPSRDVATDALGRPVLYGAPRAGR